jgi:hypothetical protein
LLFFLRLLFFFDAHTFDFVAAPHSLQSVAQPADRAVGVGFYGYCENPLLSY